MRLELNEDKKIVEADAAGNAESESGNVNRKPQNLTPEQEKAMERAERKAKFASLSVKDKFIYIWDYYKWPIIIAIVVTAFTINMVSEIRDNKRPVYLQAVLINSNLALDNSDTLEKDYVSQYNVDLDTYKLYIDTSVKLSLEGFDQAMMANQQKLISEYQTAQLDAVIGPVEIMEGPANCNAYGDLSQLLPQELIAELKDRDYEFYYYDGAKIASRQKELSENSDYYDDDEEYLPEYFAGIYLDNCSYLNNIGEYGAFRVPEKEDDRVIFTIPVNSTRVDHAIEFLKFLIQNR